MFNLPKFSREDIDTTQMSREDWLNQRDRYLGASEVGAIIHESTILAWKLQGLIPEYVKCNKYGSPLQVWERKKNMHHNQEELDESYAIRKGIELEDGVAKLFEWKTGYTVSRYDKVLFLRDSDINFMGANLDRVINELNIPLEIKNSDYQVFKNGIPFNYYIQCGVQQRIWGSDTTILAAELGRELATYEVTMSDELFELVKIEARRFWIDYYLADVKPEPENNDYDYLKDKYSNVEPKTKLELDILEGNVIDNLYEEMTKVKEQIKELEAQEKAIQSRLIEKIKDNEQMVGVRYIYNYKKTSDRLDVDKDTLKEKYPEIYNECLVTKSGYRRWNIKQKK